MKKMKKYGKYEFCKNMECKELKNDNICYKNPKDCIHTAKQFHEWLKENDFEIIKALPYTCIHCKTKFQKMIPHICGGVMRIYKLKFRDPDRKIHTLGVRKIS